MLQKEKKIGLFLSGGLDSSSIGIIAHRLGIEVVAGVFAYDNSAINYEGISSDYEYSKIVAKREGMKLLTIEADVDHIDILSELVKFMDFPIADPAIVPTYLVAKRLGAETDLVLSGHGGDELFGGYTTYDLAIKESIYGRFIPKTFFEILKNFAEWGQSISVSSQQVKLCRDAIRFAEGSIYPFPLNHERYRSYFTIDEINRLIGDNAWFKCYTEKLELYLSFINPESTKLQMLQFLDLYGALDSHNLAYTEWACKAAEIDVGFPIMNKAMVEYSLSLPDTKKIKGKVFKAILRDAMKDILPEEILQRKPAGLAMPVRFWFSNKKNINRVFDRIIDKDAKIRRCLNPVEIDKIINIHLKGKADNTLKLWVLLTLELFLQEKEMVL